jgi:hypothetical protein
MVTNKLLPATVRGIRAVGLLSLIGWVAWVSSRFEIRPLWHLTLREIVAVLIWASGLHLAVRLVEALTRTREGHSWKDYAMAYALVVLSCLIFLWYFNAHRVGPLDAQWYQNATSDFLTQARSGTFPVVLGSTITEFNGAVHPFRSAPWQFILADGVDILSGRALAPVAVEHITAIASYCAAVLILYVGFARARPQSRNCAWLFAFIYATAPAASVPFFHYDMYMTLTAQPVMAAAMLCAHNAVEDDSIVASGWLGVFLAALWYCHPPMALLMGMVAGAVAATGIAVRGVTARRLFGAAVGLGTFGALATPYFISMSELSRTETPRLASFVMPLAGLGLCLFSTAGFLRTRYLPWLAVLPTAILCLNNFQPTLVPFALCFSVAMVVTALATRSCSRLKDAAWISLCSLAAALLACKLFANTSIPGAAAYWLPRGWGGYLLPITAQSGLRDQPGFTLCLLIAGMIATVFATPSTYAQIAAAAALMLLVSFGCCGDLSKFFWGNVPEDITEVLGTNYDFRVVPVMAVVAVTGGYFWFTSVRGAHPAIGRVIFVLVLCSLPWAIWETGTIIYDTRNFKIDDQQTAVRNRSENVALEHYAWDLLPLPRFLSNGVMDPALETRFWSDADHSKAAIDPDQIERALEAPGQRPIGLSATPIPTGKSWLSMEPRIELDPGQRVLVRFDFLGKYLDDAYLIIQGQTIYREYRLPSSGLDYAFGFNPGNTHTLSLWNSGATHESLQLLVTRYGSHAYDLPGPDPYWNMYQTPFDPKRAPIELYSLIPLRLRVDAPHSGYVETFRTSIPGYKVYVDGKPVVVHSSSNALVSVRLEPGVHDLWVRFAGTVRLHTAIRWSLTGWLIAALAAVVQLRAMCRRTALEFTGMMA